jgi:hypothetical protein
MKTTRVLSRGAVFMVTAALVAVLVLGCGSGPDPAVSSPADELTAAIRETSDYLNKQLPKGNKLVILNIQSDFPALSEYIIDELIANTVNDKVFSVVDRRQLDTIRAELDFQMSGEVDDDTAQALGRMAGAQSIVSGAVSRIGDLYRLRVRALSVQSAQIEGQFNRNIPDSPTVAALIASQATGYSGGATYGGTAAAAKPAPAPAPAPARTSPAPAVTPIPAQAATPAPAPPPVNEAPTVYKIGDTGPAGGLVFYDKGDNANGWRYLEAASKDAGTAQWGANGHQLGGTDTKVGAGKRNTDVIMYYLRNAGEGDRAAVLATQYTEGGYKDWFLPSKDELNLIYRNLRFELRGEFSMGFYWSSSENNDASAWSQRFSDGYQSNNYRYAPGEGAKGQSYPVRAIRAF